MTPTQEENKERQQGQSLITPGYEAGSDNCDGCKFVESIESEQEAEELVSKKKIEKIIHHPDMSPWRDTKLMKKLERIVRTK